MRTVQFFISYVLFHCIISCFADDSSVVEYTSVNFPEKFEDINHFVMFYAPWCGHCKRLQPIWEELAKSAEDDKKVTIAKVDCTAEHELCSTHDITGYPTLKLFKTGGDEAIKYRGTRDYQSLTAFLTEQLGGPSTTSEDALGNSELTEENFNEVTSVGNHFIKFYAPWCGHCQKLAPTWELFTNSMENDPNVNVARVDCTVHRTVCNSLDIKGYPTLLFIRGGVSVEKYSGQRTLEDLQAFVRKMAGTEEKTDTNEETANTPGGPLLTAENFSAGIADGVTFVKFFAPWCGHCKRLSPVWSELGSRLSASQRIQLSRVDCTQPTSRDLCNEQEVEGFPTLLVYKNGEKISEYNGSRNVEDMYQFLTKYLEHDEL